jgi:hypothetical protein
LKQEKSREWAIIDDVVVTILYGGFSHDIMVSVPGGGVYASYSSHKSHAEVRKEALIYAEKVLQREFKLLMEQKVNPMMKQLNSLRKHVGE